MAQVLSPQTKAPFLQAPLERSQEKGVPSLLIFNPQHLGTTEGDALLRVHTFGPKSSIVEKLADFNCSTVGWAGQLGASKIASTVLKGRNFTKI